MKTFLAGILIAFTLPVFTLQTFAQEDKDPPVKNRKWSINGWINTNIPVSASMRGSIAEFRADVSRDYNNRKYPFRSDELQYAVGWGGRVFYAINDDINLYLGFGGNFFDTRALLSNDEAFLAVWSLQLGAEYSLFERTAIFNVFGRLGISTNWLSGMTYYDYGFGIFQTKVPTAGRLGIDAETGLRFLIPGTAVALEGSACYSNANLLGKSYTKPKVQPSSDLYERELNDGKNPDDANDASRTIDFLQLKVGARIWF